MGAERRVKLSEPRQGLLRDLADSEEGALRLGGRYLRIATGLVRLGLVAPCFGCGGRVYEITKAGRDWLDAGGKDQ